MSDADGRGTVFAMAVSRTRIEKNLTHIRAEIASACKRSGKHVDEIAIVAVTKSVDVETIRTAVDLGLKDVGESRVQQLTERVAELEAMLQRRRSESPPAVRWHMVGHVQRNKVKAALAAAQLIHSVDSLRLAEDINNRGERDDMVADVLLQVNCSQESQKHGVAVGAAVHLGELMDSMKHLRLVGLMTMAPLVDDPEKARPTFTRLRELFEEMRHDKIGGPAFRHLSMGMSQDYVVAVEEGATMLRIGSVLFT